MSGETGFIMFIQDRAINTKHCKKCVTKENTRKTDEYVAKQEAKLQNTQQEDSRKY
jgi:hypothetical protein